VITVAKDVVVDRAAEAVYDFLAEVRNEERWNPNVISIETRYDGPLAVGETFEGVYRQGGRMRFALVEAVRPTTLVFEGGGRTMALMATITLARFGSATRVRMKAEMEPRGAFRLLAPLMRRLIERQYERVTESFRTVVEADTGAASLSRAVDRPLPGP
jgi:carbon monoxide dehydrogenase subunit G